MDSDAQLSLPNSTLSTLLPVGLVVNLIIRFQPWVISSHTHPPVSAFPGASAALSYLVFQFVLHQPVAAS